MTSLPLLLNDWLESWTSWKIYFPKDFVFWRQFEVNNLKFTLIRNRIQTKSFYKNLGLKSGWAKEQKLPPTQLLAVLGKDVLKENKLEDPNDDNTALDNQSFLPKGVPLGK